MSEANIIYLTQHQFGIPHVPPMYNAYDETVSTKSQNETMRTDVKLVLGVRASKLAMLAKNL